MNIYEFYTILCFLWISNALYFSKCLAKVHSTIESFVHEKVQSQKLLCLYTFDLSETNGFKKVSNDSFYFVPSRVYEERCPFGDLQYDPTQVKPLVNGQLGMHLSRKRSANATVMVRSTDVIKARQFYHWLLDPSSDGGYTFELVFRRRLFEDQAMTLVSIMSGFQELCGNTGFHIETDHNNGIVVAFPVLYETEEYYKCRELIFKSSEPPGEIFKSSSCTIPPLGTSEENTPVIHLTVRIARSSSSSKEKDEEKKEKDPLIGVNFYIRYTDPITTEENTCHAVRYAKLPSTDLKLVHQMDEDNLRLLIGQTSALKSRKNMYPLRQVSLEFVREEIRQRLYEQISNSSLSLKETLPKLWNFRFTEVKGSIFGDELFSIKSPTAYVKDLLNELEGGGSINNDDSSSNSSITSSEKLADEKRIDKLVDYLMEQLNKQIGTTTTTTTTTDSNSIFSSTKDDLDAASLLDAEGHLREKRDPIARVNGTKTQMDLFLFCMYNISLSNDQVKDNMAQYLIPLKPPLVYKKKIDVSDNIMDFVKISLDFLDTVYNKSSVNVTLVVSNISETTTCLHGDNNIFSSRKKTTKGDMNITTTSTNVTQKTTTWSFGPEEIKEIWFKPCKKKMKRIQEEKDLEDFEDLKDLDDDMETKQPDFVLNVSSVVSQVSRKGQVEIYIDIMKDIVRPNNQTIYLNPPIHGQIKSIWMSLGKKESPTYKKIEIISFPRHGKLYDKWEISSKQIKKNSHTYEEIESFFSIFDPRMLEDKIEMKKQYQIHRKHDEKVFFSTELVYVYDGDKEWQKIQDQDQEDTFLDSFIYCLVDDNTNSKSKSKSKSNSNSNNSKNSNNSNNSNKEEKKYVFSDFGYITFKYRKNSTIQQEQEKMSTTMADQKAAVYEKQWSTTKFSATTTSVVDLKENTFKVISLLLLPPNESFYHEEEEKEEKEEKEDKHDDLFVSNITFTIIKYPVHGQLYQYDNRYNRYKTRNVRSIDIIGQNLQRSTTFASMVEDPFGRIVYVPDLHYHNTRTNKQEEEEEEEEEEEKIDFGLFDFFTYKIFSNGIEIKEPNHVWRINLRVFNLPSEIVFLPPVQFKAPFDARRGDNVSVSIFLSDPEIFTKIFEQDKHIEYHIQVKAIDGFSEFIIPHTLYGISEENILTLCGVIRPCWISLVENETTSSLSLLIKESNWNPSHFELKGNLRTIQQAFKQVLIRDWSLSVDEDKKRRHVCAFQISATRIVPVNSALSNSSAWMELKVVYVSQNEYALLKSSSLNLKHTILSKNSIFWMIFIAWFLWFVLLYAGCACGCWCDCLCCCCLSHRLEKKRQRYKQKAKEDYETFKDKVVQTDEEYNILLYHIADLIFEPDLEIATSLYRCICLQGSLTSQIVAVESLLILLETERQGLRFVTKLVLQDLVKIPKSAKHQKYLLCTDFLKEFTKNALGFFCSMHMDSNMMIDKLKDFLIFCSMDNSPFRLAISIIHFFQCHHEFLPVEIIIICRVFSVVGSDIASTSTRRLELVHEVFFYYFLGPVLCQSFEGDSSLYQMTRLFYLIEATWDSEIVTEVADEVVEEIEEQFAFQEMYENFLNFLLESSTLCSSFVPGDKGKSKDPHLLSLCMMNLHSLLDQYMGSLMLHYNETPRFHETQEMEDDSIRRKPLHNVFLLKELVDALSLPFVGCIDGINIVSPDWYIHRHQLELWRQEFLDSFQPFNGLSNPEETRLRRWSNSHSQSEDHHDFEDLEMGSCTLIPPYGGSHDSFHGVDHTNAPYAPYRQPSL